LPAEILAPTEKDIVLDMCAAPGSKTTQLAQLMENKGTLVSVELKQERIPSLINNIERLGINKHNRI
jgi:16S rRNA C967 or C1407 C5-methylase (RsmB/RsmF family)